MRIRSSKNLVFPFNGNRRQWHPASYTETEPKVLIVGLGRPIADLVDHTHLRKFHDRKSTLACLQVISRLRDSERNDRGEKRDALLQIMARNFETKDDVDVFTKLFFRDTNILRSTCSHSFYWTINRPVKRGWYSNSVMFLSQNSIMINRFIFSTFFCLLKTHVSVERLYKSCRSREMLSLLFRK